METLKVGAINRIENGVTIYSEGHKVENIALLLSGSVTMYNATFQFTLSPGDFIGIMDLQTGNNCFTYEASQASAIYLFEARSMEDIGSILQVNKDYRGFMVRSLNRQLIAMSEHFDSCKLAVNEIYQSAKEIYSEYAKFNLNRERIASMAAFFMSTTEYTKVLPLREEVLENIRETVAIPADVVNTYYSYLTNSGIREISDKIKVSIIFVNELKQLSRYIAKLCRVLFSTEEQSLYKVLCEEVCQLSPSYEHYEVLTKLVDQVMDQAIRMESLYGQWFEKSAPLNRGAMERMYHLAVHGSNLGAEGISTEKMTVDQVEGELQGSLDKILQFGKIEAQVSERFKVLIEQFLGFKDYSEVSEKTRSIRKEITSIFFHIYKKVFLEAYHNSISNKSVELFLQFGFVDERLMTKEQLKELCQLSVEPTNTYYCNCYTAFEWLGAIYRGEKEPSKNEYDLDYRDYLRSLRKEGKITEQEQKNYLADVERKLDYEINNMFSHNMKLTNGRISTFVPILYSEVMPANIGKYFLHATEIDVTIRDIVKIDFSAFYREVLFYDPNNSIQKELVMKQCVPDIILFPNSGRNAIMWQEVADKRRDSSGRFCFPILFEANLTDEIIRIIARFRWELCRTLQGLAWNDIKNKCLTSEYCDYIQFYRKNRELSEEKKDRIRLQLQKARNNSRECFVLDYEQWIKYEATGALRLNKVVRQILATYCPYHVNLRKQLISSPVYSVSIQKYERYAKTRARVLEAKALVLSRDGIEVPTELKDTIAYFNLK